MGMLDNGESSRDCDSTNDGQTKDSVTSSENDTAVTSVNSFTELKEPDKPPKMSGLPKEHSQPHSQQEERQQPHKVTLFYPYF
jgi:hypothetical protein